MVVNDEIGRTEAGTGQLGIDERHSNVARALGSRKPLVIVCEPPGVQEGPALPWCPHGAVVAQKSATSALIIFPNPVQGYVDGEGRGVMVGHQGRLLIGLIADDEG